jgi:hypothetical protein
MMVDLLRHAGEFKSALRICDEGLKKNPEEIISNILRFENILLGKSYTSCHTIDEAVEGMQRPP